MAGVIPDDNRIEPGSANIAPAKFPTGVLPDEVDAGRVSEELINTFSGLLERKDFSGIANLFSEEGYWRDHLCLTWDFHTFKSPSDISEFLIVNGNRLRTISLDKSAPCRMPSVSQLDAFGESKCIAFFVQVTTDVGSGQGVVRLVHQDNAWRIITFYTALRQLNGFEEPLGSRRPVGASHGGGRNMKNWLEQRISDADFIGTEPVVLIIGAGQGGLTSAARLKMLNVPTLVIDQEARVGDNWRQRYRQLVLHDPIWFDHMPYMEFPAHWPIFTPKDKLADFFEAYVSLLELNVWTTTRMVASSWDSTMKHWNITLERQVGETIERRTLHPRHIIQATGHSGKKNMPAIKGTETFRGKLCHSSEFPGAQQGANNRRAVVVGSCNSGHDIAQDLCENGYEVTMVQRSSTCVVSSKSISEIGLGSLYSEAIQAEIPVDDADLILWSIPTPLSKALQVQVTQVCIDNDRTLLDGLEKAGFRLDKGPDGSGLFYKYFQRGGGYYIDVGASQLVIEGRIKIKSGHEIVEVTPEGLIFSDGSRLEADEIIFATGYQNMRSQTSVLFGDEIADKCHSVWGFDKEGEFKTMWRRSGHPGFWYMGGNLALSRYFGRFLALQIKALEEGLTKLPV